MTADAETQFSLTHMTISNSFIVRRHAKFQGSLQAKQLNLAFVPVMVESAISCLKELKDDRKISTWFKDCASVFKELMGKN